MTKEEIIRMAHLYRHSSETSAAMFSLVEAIDRYTTIVRDYEREACAKLCDDLDDDLPDGLAGWQYGEAIRARGQE